MAEPFVLNALVNLQGFTAGSIAKAKEQMQQLSGSVDFGNLSKVGKVGAPAIKSVKDLAAALAAGSKVADALGAKIGKLTASIVADFQKATTVIKEFNATLGKAQTAASKGVTIVTKAPATKAAPGASAASKIPAAVDPNVAYGPLHGKTVNPNVVLAQAKALQAAAAQVMVPNEVEALPPTVPLT